MSARRSCCETWKDFPPGKWRGPSDRAKPRCARRFRKRASKCARLWSAISGAIYELPGMGRTNRSLCGGRSSGGRCRREGTPHRRVRGGPGVLERDEEKIGMAVGGAPGGDRAGTLRGRAGACDDATGERARAVVEAGLGVQSGAGGGGGGDSPDDGAAPCAEPAGGDGESGGG